MTIQNPTYTDLIDCLTTLASLPNSRDAPVEYPDLYYHACDLATALDDRETGDIGLGLSWWVKHCSFDSAIETAHERASAAMQ